MCVCVGLTEGSIGQKISVALCAFFIRGNSAAQKQICEQDVTYDVSIGFVCPCFAMCAICL